MRSVSLILLSLLFSLHAVAAGSFDLRYHERGRRCAGAHVRSRPVAVQAANLSDLADHLKEIRDLGSERVEAKLHIREAPMWSRATRELKARVDAQLKETGLDELLEIQVHYKPSRTGFLGGLEKARYFFPMRQDYERPIREEFTRGAPGVVLAESTASLYALLSLPPQSAIPLLVSHFGLLASIAAFQKSMANWRGRTMVRPESRLRPVAEHTEAFLKEAMTSFVFVFNYKFSSNLPAVYNSIRQGATQALHDLSQQAGQFMIDQGVTTGIQTAFFYLTFARGGFRWLKLTENDPELAAGSRRALSIIMPSIFSISGPMVLWASTSHSTILSLGPVQLNGGHLGLLALTAAGSVIAYNPMILNSAIAPIDRYVHGPLNRGAQRARAWVKSLTEKIPAE